MHPFRFNQGSQKVAEGVQRVAFRPTCAEKVRRLGCPLPVALSNLLTSSNLAAHTHPRIGAHTHPRARVYAYF
jgi:hypothetical protein